MRAPYTHFRLIAYEVHTAAAADNAAVISGWSPGTECPAIARVPVPATVPDDARIRLKRLASVVDLARNQVAAGGRTDNTNTLKIFLVPEFYFRPPASTGAGYTGNTYPLQVNTQMLDALNQMFVAADFADWLFVCGTVMWNTLADTLSGGETLYFNTAIVVRGGRTDALHVVEKRVPSQIDGVPAPLAPQKFGGPYAGPGYDPKVRLFLERWSQRKRRILRFDGIDFGVEVCLDHADHPSFRTLKRVLVDWRANEPVIPPAIPKLHLLAAGGMPVEPGSVAAKANGYILRNDGLHHARQPATSQMFQVQSYTRPVLGFIPWAAGPGDASSTANLGPPIAPQYVPIPAGAQQVPPPGAPYSPIPQQKLAFYPVTAMP
jgi:hypothetical protein